MNNIKSKLKTRGLRQQIRWRKITEQDVLVIAANQFAGHGVARSSLFYNNYVGIRNKTNDLILNLTPENVTQHSRIE